MKKIADRCSKISDSKTLALAAKAIELKSQGNDVISLTVGEPDFTTPKNVKEAAISAIKEDFTKYTAASGILELKKAVVKKYQDDFKVELTPGNIVISNGAKHSLANVILAVCEAGDEVLIPTPAWVSYPELVKLSEAKPVIVECSLENNFKITPEQFKASITEKTKMAILCSPSNPCGTVYSKAELDELVKIIKDTGIYVIYDEIYEKLVYDDFKHVSLLEYQEIRDQVICINGVSKAYAMTGWRIGYSIANEEITKACSKIQSHMTSGPNSVAQKAAVTALADETKEEVEKMRKQFEKRRNSGLEELKGLPSVKVAYPEGAFYFYCDFSAYFGKKFKDVTIENCDDLAEYFINECYVVTVPGSAFGTTKHLRFSYACAEDTFKKAVIRMKEALLKLK